MDFDSALPPTLAPLEHSGSSNEFEEQFRLFVLDMFSELLSTSVFDANVLGAPHLGSFDLVRREVNSDGLVLLQGDREESSTRYVYRTWRARNGQGRGLHFLRSYLQLLFPNVWEIEQVWCSTDDAYPESTVVNDWWMPRMDDPDLFMDGGFRMDYAVPWRVQGAQSDRPNIYLTSRVNIYLTYDEVDVVEAQKMLTIFRATVPAKIVPKIRFWKRGRVAVMKSIGGSFYESGHELSGVTYNGSALTVNGAVIVF